MTDSSGGCRGSLTTSQKLIEAIADMTGRQLMDGELKIFDDRQRVRICYGYVACQEYFIIEDPCKCNFPSIYCVAKVIDGWTYPVPHNSELVKVGDVWERDITKYRTGKCTIEWKIEWIRPDRHVMLVTEDRDGQRIAEVNTLNDLDEWTLLKGSAVDRMIRRLKDISKD